jgi:hypothetical protein
MRKLATMRLILALLQFLAVPAHATLKIYYDPHTGNVWFDTRQARGGGVSTYYYGMVARTTQHNIRRAWETDLVERH